MPEFRIHDRVRKEDGQVGLVMGFKEVDGDEQVLVNWTRMENEWVDAGELTSVGDTLSPGMSTMDRVHKRSS